MRVEGIAAQQVCHRPGNGMGFDAQKSGLPGKLYSKHRAITRIAVEGGDYERNESTDVRCQESREECNVKAQAVRRVVGGYDPYPPGKHAGCFRRASSYSCPVS